MSESALERELAAAIELAEAAGRVERDDHDDSSPPDAAEGHGQLGDALEDDS